jgi:hypothetical protein
MQFEKPLNEYTGQFGHEKPERLGDYEWCNIDDERGIRVYVSKVGGGTLGKEYEGFWHYLVISQRAGESLEILFQGSDLETPVGANHREAAELAADYYEQLREEYERSE